VTNDYHFITHWRVEGSAQAVWDLISNPQDFPRWWPEVYLEVNELEPGEPGGVGRRFRLHTKGRLPYTLRWESRTVDTQPPRRLEIRATGDFEGRGVWTLEQNGGFVEVEFDWNLTAEKPLIRYLSFLLKPIFSANHRWAMAKGEEGLVREMEKSR